MYAQSKRSRHSAPDSSRIPTNRAIPPHSFAAERLPYPKNASRTSATRSPDTTTSRTTTPSSILTILVQQLAMNSKSCVITKMALPPRASLSTASAVRFMFAPSKPLVRTQRDGETGRTTIPCDPFPRPFGFLWVPRQQKRRFWTERKTEKRQSRDRDRQKGSRRKSLHRRTSLTWENAIVCGFFASLSPSVRPAYLIPCFSVFISVQKTLNPWRGGNPR